MDSCSPHLQMVPPIIARLRADECFFVQRVCKGFLEKWAVDANFELVASQLRAERMRPIISGLLLPEVEYPLQRINRESCGVSVAVIYNGMGNTFEFLLPETYGDMVTDDDIDENNSGRVKYALIKTIKKCGPNRVPFDKKNYTWDLALVRE